MRAFSTIVQLPSVMYDGLQTHDVGTADHSSRRGDALARSDVQAALALFTEDAVIDSESGFCAKAPCVGKAAIQKDLERYVADKSRHATPLNTYVSGNVLVTRFEARSAAIQKAGVDRIILWSIREMRGDKIASTRCCLPERTDPQTARFLEWDYAHPTQ